MYNINISRQIQKYLFLSTKTIILLKMIFGTMSEVEN